MKNIKNFAKKYLPLSMVHDLRRGRIAIKSYLNQNNLDKLAQLQNCDKGGIHFYTPHYQVHFSNLKLKEINLLELGIGGYKHPDQGGASLRMWKNYFPKGKIFGIDIYDKTLLQEKRIRTFQGSQTDTVFLDLVVKSIGEIDVIIDDGSHVSKDIIESFNYLFPKLKNGGIYVVEDLQCSYWKWYGGNSEDLNDPQTANNFFKSLIHGLNYKEFTLEGYEPTYFDTHITGIHFYHNLVFIYKGDNLEESSYLIKNQLPGWKK